MMKTEEKSNSCEDCPIFKAKQEEMLQRYSSSFDAAFEMSRWKCPAERKEEEFDGK